MRHPILIFGITGISVLFYFLTFWQKDYWLESHIVAVGKLPIWLQSFHSLAVFGVIVSFLTALLWYVLGAFVFKVNKWAQSKKIMFWAFLFLVPLVVAGISCYLTEAAREGTPWAYLFYFANNILTYYLATLFFSPPAFKYTPLGSIYVRIFR